MIWYIEDAGKAKKIPEEVLKYKIENYEVSGDKLVVNEEIKNWVPLRETQIWKEHRKDTEKDGGSNFEKESTQSHTWRCEKCGNKISEIPCKYCLNAGVNSTFNPGKRENKRLISLVIVIGIALAVFVYFCNAIFLNGGESKDTLDPNRTYEACTFEGTTRVFPASHQNGLCHTDGDGYYWPTLGHHHHK